MAENLAQQELQSLLDMQSQGAAASANARKLLQQRDGPEYVPDGEAKFALPEAIATAVGAGWLLGPVGGVLFGVAQGILGKKEEQAALDAWTQDQNALNEVGNIYGNEFEQAMLLAKTDEQREQISGLKAMLDAGMAKATGSPELREQGAEEVAAAMQGLNTLRVKDEEQQISFEAENARLERELGAEKYDRFTALMTQYDAQSQSFEDGRLAANKARDALNRGNPVDLVAATRLAIRTVEPTGPLTDEDVKAYAGLGNIGEKLENMAQEWLGTGAQLSDPMRLQFIEMINAFERQNAVIQMTRDLRFQERGEIAELGARELGMFNRVTELPENLGGQFMPQEDSIIEKTRSVATDAAEALVPTDNSKTWFQKMQDRANAYANREKR